MPPLDTEKMFAPDLLLPEQFFQDKKKSTRQEKALLLAVLEDAVHCFTSYLSASKTREKRLYEEAKEWLFGNDTRWFLSFYNICLALDLDGEYIRRGLLQLEKQASSPLSKTADSASKPGVKKQIRQPLVGAGRTKKTIPR